MVKITRSYKIWRSSAYSKQLMCEDTGISYEDLHQIFSFNSPYGACPACKGLGQCLSVDMEAMIPDDSLKYQ